MPKPLEIFSTSLCCSLKDWVDYCSISKGFLIKDYRFLAQTEYHLCWVLEIKLRNSYTGCIYLCTVKISKLMFKQCFTKPNHFTFLRVVCWMVDCHPANLLLVSVFLLQAGSLATPWPLTTVGFRLSVVDFCTFWSVQAACSGIAFLRKGTWQDKLERMNCLLA